MQQNKINRAGAALKLATISLSLPNLILEAECAIDTGTLSPFMNTYWQRSWEAQSEHGTTWAYGATASGTTAKFDGWNTSKACGSSTEITSESQFNYLTTALSKTITKPRYEYASIYSMVQLSDAPTWYASASMF